AVIDRKVRFEAPIVVFSTSSAVPVDVASVLTIVVLFWVALTVPPPVALKAVLLPAVERLRPPVKLIVAPVLVWRLMPRPLSVIAPLKAIVPAVWLVTSTERPAAVVLIELAKL